MSSALFTELVNIAKNQSYIIFKKKIMTYTYNYVLMSSLESWFAVFSKKCPICDNPMIINDEGEYSIYSCEDCDMRFRYYYKHLEESYMKKTFMNMLL
jgi:hypothetical protein